MLSFNKKTTSEQGRVGHDTADGAESSIVIPAIFFGVIAFLLWSYFFELDQFVRATGKVFSSSRIQVIQSVDGGVLSELKIGRAHV